MMEMNPNIDFYDIYEYYYIPYWQKTWFWVIVLFFIGLLLGLLIFYIWYRRRRLITPWDWAFAELNKLTKKQMQTKDDIKRCYFDLTRIIKTYLTKRFGFQTQEKTDEELVAFLEKQKFDTNLIEMLKKTAQGAQWIKFANETALKAQIDQDVQAVRHLIEQTRHTETKK